MYPKTRDEIIQYQLDGWVADWAKIMTDFAGDKDKIKQHFVGKSLPITPSDFYDVGTGPGEYLVTEDMFEKAWDNYVKAHQSE